MEIINMKVGELIPYENNPRKNDEAVEYVANSIRQFGFKVPIVVDKNNVIVAGHTRLKAAQLLSLEEVPVVVADDLTPEQVNAFRLADNKTGELAGWDFDALSDEMAELEREIEGMDFDMSDFGFEVTSVVDAYIDDFFDRGVEAKAKDQKYEVKVECENESEQHEVYAYLKEGGYSPAMA